MTMIKDRGGILPGERRILHGVRKLTGLPGDRDSASSCGRDTQTNIRRTVHPPTNIQFHIITTKTKSSFRVVLDFLILFRFMYRLELYWEILLRFALILWDLILDSSRFSQPEGTRKTLGHHSILPCPWGLSNPLGFRGSRERSPQKNSTRFW